LILEPERITFRKRCHRSEIRWDFVSPPGDEHMSVASRSKNDRR
jgi:hypothetical protein